MPKVLDTTNIHFTFVYEQVGKLLRVLVTIDEIVGNNTVLQNHWNQYKL